MEQSVNDTTNSVTHAKIFEFVRKCAKNLHLLQGIETSSESIMEITDYLVANRPDILINAEIILKAMPFGNFAYKRQMTIEDFSITPEKTAKLKQAGETWYSNNQMQNLIENILSQKIKELQYKIELLEEEIREWEFKWTTQPEIETKLGWKEFNEYLHELMDKNSDLEKSIQILTNGVKATEKIVVNLKNKFFEARNEPEKLIKILEKLLNEV